MLQIDLSQLEKRQATEWNILVKILLIQWKKNQAVVYKLDNLKLL
jgi:hypothetical protein